MIRAHDPSVGTVDARRVAEWRKCDTLGPFWVSQLTPATVATRHHDFPLSRAGLSKSYDAESPDDSGVRD